MAEIEFRGIAHSYKRQPAGPEDYALQGKCGPKFNPEKSADYW